MSWVLDPLAYGFFVRALVACLLIGAMCGALSVFVVLRRASYIGHGLAHSVLGGVAVGAALGWGIYPGAIVATLLSALLIDRVARQPGLHTDAAIGTVTTAMFAIGIVVVSTTGSTISTEAILFGNVLGVTSGDLWLAAAAATIFASTLFLLHKPLLFVTFDPEVAGVSGVRAGAIEFLINLLTAMVVIVSVRVLGVLLIAAAVVIPGALARLMTRSFGPMLALATAVGIGSGVLGLYGSFHIDVPSGPSIVLVAAGAFAVVFAGRSLFSRRQLVSARRRERGPFAAASRLP